MFSFFRQTEKTPIEAEYLQLKMAARLAQQSGDMRKYADLVVEINRLLVLMFPSRKGNMSTKA